VNDKLKNQRRFFSSINGKDIKMPEKYICIHGHFYQPPRENAWLEAVEIQDTAHPYHDWNQRITEECYFANAYSRILDQEEKITRIVNNYEKMSFNFGPTLLNWMKKNVPDIHEAIVKADLKSINRFSGHGSALAQAYHHIIMPLANSRDKYTQVFWGIQDFQSRFGRKPEGMWLPETAVDFETLKIMAELGILFTILSPNQAARKRKIGEKKWQDVMGGIINPRMPYLQKLSETEIVIFFYDGPISQAVAFGGLLKNGEKFAQRLLEGFVDRDEPQLVHIATDGESYGHHSLFGDMALAYAVKYIEDENLATITNYGEYLEKHPPSYEVEIIENTSWSCSHGVKRWCDDCGCGAVDGQNQQWRRPLREALDVLRDNAADAFEKELGKFFPDPWKVRNDYIDIIQDRSPENLEIFIKAHTQHNQSTGLREKIRILKLLEMQRHAMQMYTSCGWFFHDLSGIETIQIIQYAGRLVQLYTELFNQDLVPHFLQKMAEAKSNISECGDGKQIYENQIRPSILNLKGVASHYAISSLFEDFPDRSTLFCYDIKQVNYRMDEAGIAKLCSGCVEITSEITRESALLQFAILYVGDHNLSCGIHESGYDKTFEELIRISSDRFDRAEFTEIFSSLDNYFGNSIYSLNSLFRDGQRKIISLILDDKVKDALSVYQRLYRQNIPLMRFLKGSATPCPPALNSAGTLVLNQELKEQFKQDVLNYDTIMELLKEAKLAGIKLEAATLEYTLRKNIEAKAKQFEKNQVHLELLNRINNSIDLVYNLPFDVNLRKLQNVFYDAAVNKFADHHRKKKLEKKSVAKYIDLFRIICEKLNIRIF
jgi:alpha-amylase/alpha-mannosidase (GH57 family)